MGTNQIEDLARPFLSMADSILSYYQDEEHEKEFQAWCERRHNGNGNCFGEGYDDHTGQA